MENINNIKVNICIGDYSENLEIVFMMTGDRVLDIGEESYKFINKII